MVTVVYPTNLWVAGVLFVGLVEGQSCSYRSLAELTPWLWAVKNRGMNSPNMNGSFPWKKGTISKGKVFWKGSSSKPIIFFRAHFFSFSFVVFFKDCKKIARKQGSRKKPTTSEFPPFHVSLSGFLLVKLARVKPRISRIGIDYILRRLGGRETNPQHKTTLLPIIMVRWKMAVWWKVTTYDYWRDIPFLTATMIMGGFG